MFLRIFFFRSFRTMFHIYSFFLSSNTLFWYEWTGNLIDYILYLHFEHYASQNGDKILKYKFIFTFYICYTLHLKKRRIIVYMKIFLQVITCYFLLCQILTKPCISFSNLMYKRLHICIICHILGAKLWISQY